MNVFAVVFSVSHACTSCFLLIAEDCHLETDGLSLISGIIVLFVGLANGVVPS
mgnify:CR=1 FL=1